jgi:inhibitor of cysteine peptidase
MPRATRCQAPYPWGGDFLKRCHSNKRGMRAATARQDDRGCIGICENALMPTLRKLDRRASLDLRVGEDLVLELSENPTTGYRWQLQVSGDALSETAPSTYARSSSAIGGGGQRTFRLIAKKPGIARIHATLSRAWLPDEPSEEHLVVVQVGERNGDD